MRIWSIHPQYLDTKGLLALWREALLAKKVLEGRTKGYKNHPQLNRFKSQVNPADCINHYLLEVYNEAERRGFNFDKSKISPGFSPVRMTVTRGQICFETAHLLNKLRIRDIKKFQELASAETPVCHPVFSIREGDIEAWERIR